MDSPNGAVHQTGGDLIDGIVDLVKVVSAVLQTIVQQLEILRGRIPGLCEFTRILGKVIPQFIGLIQTVLGTHHDVVHRLLSGQTVLLHEGIDAPEGLIHVNAVQFL